MEEQKDTKNIWIVMTITFFTVSIVFGILLYRSEKVIKEMQQTVAESVTVQEQQDVNASADPVRLMDGMVQLRHGYRDADRRGRHWPDHDHGDLRGDPHGQDHLPLRFGSGKGRAGGQGVRGQVRRDHHPHLRQQDGSGKVSADRGRDHRQNALHRQELGEAPQRHRLCFQRGHDGRGKGCGRECGGLLEADHYLQEQGHHAGVRRRRDHQGGSAGNQRPGAGQALQNL